MAEFPSADASIIAAEVAKLASLPEASDAGLTAPLPVAAHHSSAFSSARPSSNGSSHSPSLAEKRHQPCEDESAPPPSALSTLTAPTTAPPANAPAAKKFKPHRPFQWSRFHQRHIALHIAYVGADYSGFAAANLNSAEAEVDVQIRRAETGADQLVAPGGSAFAPASSQARVRSGQ